MKKPILYFLCLFTLVLTLFQPVSAKAATTCKIPEYPDKYDSSKYPVLVIAHDSTSTYDYYYYYGSTTVGSYRDSSDNIHLQFTGAILTATYRITLDGKGCNWFNKTSEAESGVIGFSLKDKGIVSSTHSIFLPDGTPVFQKPLVPTALKGLGETVVKAMVVIAFSTIFLMGLVISFRHLVTRFREYSMRS